MDTVTLGLEGEQIGLEQFAEAVARFSLLMNELSREADAPELHWEIDELRVGSATVTSRAVTTNGEAEQADKVVRSYVAVGRGLKERSATQFTPPVREAAEGLAKLLTDGVEGIRFETPDTDLIVTEPVEPTKLEADPFTTAYGAVTGRIQTLSSRSHYRFTLYDRLHDRAVSCYLQEGQEGMVRTLWDKVATVEGKVTRGAETGRPLAVRDITAIHELAQDADPRGYRRARGALKRAQDDTTPEQRIRRLRDAG